MKRAWGNSPSNSMRAPAGSWILLYQYPTCVSIASLLNPSIGPIGTPHMHVLVMDVGWSASTLRASSASTGRCLPWLPWWSAMDGVAPETARPTEAANAASTRPRLGRRTAFGIGGCEWRAFTSRVSFGEQGVWRGPHYAARETFRNNDSNETQCDSVSLGG